MDKVVLSKPFCLIQNREEYCHPIPEIHSLSLMAKSMPKTLIPNPIPAQETFNSTISEEYQIPVNPEYESLLLQRGRDFLEKVNNDYDFYISEYPNGDLEHDNELFVKKSDYVAHVVPLQIEGLMKYIEMFIHRCSWNEMDFGDYKQIYDAGKNAVGKDKIQHVSGLAMCLMYAIPKDEYVREPETYEPAIASPQRTETF